MSPAKPTEDRVCVITGAASGIGAGLARHASSCGMRLVLADWDGHSLEQLASSLTGDALAIQTDVRKEDAVRSLASAAFDHFGSVDILFNNAGVLSSGRSWEIDDETWQRSLDINIGGVINGIRAFVPPMIAANRPSRIVNTASVGGFFPSPLMAPYTASKFAVVGLTEALAGELSAIESKVQVSLLAPGPVKTAIMDEDAPEESAQFMDALRTMADRRGMDADDFASLVFEAIDRGDYWIVPQPESLDDRLRERTAMILERRSPVTPAISKDADR